MSKYIKYKGETYRAIDSSKEVHSMKKVGNEIVVDFTNQYGIRNETTFDLDSREDSLEFDKMMFKSGYHVNSSLAHQFAKMFVKD